MCCAWGSTTGPAAACCRGALGIAALNRPATLPYTFKTFSVCLDSDIRQSHLSLLGVLSYRPEMWLF